MKNFPQYSPILKWNEHTGLWIDIRVVTKSPIRELWKTRREKRAILIFALFPTAEIRQPTAQYFSGIECYKTLMRWSWVRTPSESCRGITQPLPTPTQSLECHAPRGKVGVFIQCRDTSLRVFVTYPTGASINIRALLIAGALWR